MHSDQNVEKKQEVVVTEAMISAGLSEMSEHNYNVDTAYMLEAVFRAMCYAKSPASFTSSDK